MSPVRSVIRFRVKPGRAAEFEAAFADCGMLERPKAVAGFLGAELLRPAEGDEYLVVGAWASKEAYGEWQARAAREAPGAALRRLVETLEEPQPGGLFAVAASAR